MTYSGDIETYRVVDGKSVRLCFEITIDDKTYGPYLWAVKEKFKSLEHKMGVKVETLWLHSGWITPPKKSCHRKDKSTPLFENLDWTPVRKQKGWQ